MAGFTRKYGVDILVWYEIHGDINDAIAREKQIKGWNRAWKLRLIEERNSGWNDLTGSPAGDDRELNARPCDHFLRRKCFAGGRIR